jgi:hypothetical protein
MRRLALVLSLVLLAACAKPETPPATDAPAAPTISLADVAGEWMVQATAVGSDSVIVMFSMTASVDPEGWTMNLTDRDPVPMRITVSGDSIVHSAGPYQSVLRDGVEVSVTGSMHLVDGELVGSSVAHYAMSGADSTAHLWVTAMRVP